ncbi:MAG: hypothetical protein J1F71_01645 [Clostridiales bacterium]|nr:hypothetical protein [Clostridiales bacterium]
MKNRFTSPVTEMLSGKYKIFLIVGLSIMLGIDVVAVAVFLSSGIDTLYFIVPFLMLIVDAVYLLGVIVSNQRFTYARGFFLLYIILNFLVFIYGAISAFSSNSAVFGSGIAALWTTLHAFGILTAVVTYVYAAKLIKKWRPAQLVLSAVLPCVIVLSVGLLYIALLFADGYFGQGHTRALIYNYTSDSECEVTGVVNGKGDSIVVPYEFNGHKVTSVSANVLAIDIKNVTLHCDSSAALFTDYDKYPFYNTNLVLNVDKDNVDAVKQKFYNYAVNGMANTFHFGNRVRPTGLDKDEVYVTFDYDSEAYSLAEGKLMPTWYGKKGDTFGLDKMNVDYVRHSDIYSDEDLYACDNTTGFILAELKAGGAAIVGSKVSKNLSGVPVRFRKIYKVYTASSNDSKYDVTKHFTYSVVDGKKLDYKLTVSDNADRILDCFDRGAAFTHIVRKKVGSVWGETVNSLSQALVSGEGSDITISPYYSLVSPQVTLSQVGGKEDVVYGDDFSLTATVTHVLDTFDFDCTWFLSGTYVRKADTLEQRAKTIGTGDYTASVTVTAPEVTSLSASTTAAIGVDVVRRPLTVEWTDPVDNVYNGMEKTVTTKLLNTIAGDSIGLDYSTFTRIDAQTYTFTATLGGTAADNYYIGTGETHAFTIMPRPTAIVWNDDTVFTYDGQPHHPTATAMGINSVPLNLSYGGARTDANAKTGIKYVAVVSIPDTNYTIDADSEWTKEFTINQKQVGANWGNTELTYNGSAQAPTASAMDVGGQEMILSVNGARREANAMSGEEPYTATAYASDKNYIVNERETTTFTIAQFGLKVQWYNTSRTYSGGAQKPTALANDVNGQPITLDVNMDGGEAVDVGSDYKATAVVPNKNYIIALNAQTDFAITKYELTVTWTNTTLTYSGDEQLPKAEARGATGQSVSLTVTGGGTEVGGNYTAYAAIKEAKDIQNYSIKAGTESRGYVINPYGITVTWGQTSNVYSGDGWAPTASATGPKGEPVTVTVLGRQINVGNNYEATATVSDKNYTIASGSTCTFSITPYELTVTWENLTFTYSGEPQAPTASAIGVKNQSVTITVSGGQTNVGNNYTATASVNDKNYTIASGGTQQFSIMPYGVTVKWDEDSFLYYNGSLQAPTASATGPKGENVKLIISGGRVDAGEGTASAEIDNNPNYVIASGKTHSFSIHRLDIGVEWSNTLLTYNGTVQVPTATASGMIGNDRVIVTGGQINAGIDYRAKAVVPNNNYVIILGEDTTFVIQRKTVTVSIDDVTIEYGDKPTYTFTAVGIEDVDKATVSVKCSISYTADGDGNIPSGSYDITANIDGDVNFNYDIEVTKHGKLTVKPAPEQKEKVQTQSALPVTAKKEETI